MTPNERYWLFALTLFVAFTFVYDLLQSIDRTWCSHPVRVEIPAPAPYVSFADTTITFNGQKVHITTLVTEPGSFIWNLVEQNAAMNARLRRVEQDNTQIKQMHAKLE
jgi:hypothetical protein